MSNAAAGVARSRAFAAAVAMLEGVARWRPGVLSVLTYHRIGDPGTTPSLDPTLVSATPRDFDRQMGFIATHFRAVSAAQLLEVRRGEAELGPRSVMITFDDAYRDFALHAWPVLDRYGIPPVLFVPTAFPDRPRAFWWDRLYQAVTETERRQPLETTAGSLSLSTAEERAATFQQLRTSLKRLPEKELSETVESVIQELGVPTAGSAVLGWEELRRLASAGVTVAPHSRTHVLLDRVPLDVARTEVEGSFDDVEREIGFVLPIFAYPGGRHDDAVVAALRGIGVEVAFTTGWRGNDLPRSDWLRLKRIHVGRRSSLARIRMQLLPFLAVGHDGRRASYPR